MITRVVVSKKAEAGYRRRAVKTLPNEHLEMLAGFIHKETAYICAFIPVALESTKPDEVEYYPEDFPDFASGISKRVTNIGTIHSHPNTADTIFSDGDLLSLVKWDMDEDREDFECPDHIMAICAIETPNEENGLTRNKCRICYWPTVKPLHLRYKK